MQREEPPRDPRDMKTWSAEFMASRPPDVIIGDDYLRRWWVVPRNAGCNVYLHEILHSDNDEALHDHPWVNTSMIIEGEYFEVTPEGEFHRKEGEIISRQATSLHRLIIPDGGRAVTLFMTGPVERLWGFACPKGWVPWHYFLDHYAQAHGNTTKGCGEYA
jgi:hypothetical protein